MQVFRYTLKLGAYDLTSHWYARCFIINQRLMPSFVYESMSKVFKLNKIILNRIEILCIMIIGRI